MSVGPGAILDNRDHRTYYSETVQIPGFGHAPERCRGFDPVGFCEEGHTILGRSSCGTRYCPDHWRDWAGDATMSVVARAGAFREAAEGAGKRLSHVVVSPPQDTRYTERQFYATRSRAYEVAEEAGVRGGVCIPHPYRTTEAGNQAYAEAVRAGEVPEDYGRWRYLRERVEAWKELGEYVEASPHYHLLAAAEDIDPSGIPDGWVVERVRSFDRWDRQDADAYRDMAKTAYYALTHGAVMQGRATVTYFGEMHPSVFDPAEELAAAAVDRIEEEAAAVGGPGEEDSTPEECPRDGCEAVVREVIHLREFLEDPDAVRGVKCRTGGYTRWLRLHGLLAWTEGATDTPPPGARTSEARMLEWLEEKGRTFTADRGQVSLSVAVGRE